MPCLQSLPYPKSSIVIDDEIKVVDIPDFSWICVDDLYTKLVSCSSIQVDFIITP